MKALCVGTLCLLLTGCLADWLNRRPTAQLWLASAEPFGPAPLEIVFDVSRSRDPDGTIVAFVLDFGDGSDVVEGTTEDLEAPIPHTYDLPGSYAARLTVTDDGGKNHSVALAIVVLEPEE
jgi:PKD repeat protein